jgi:hypothetical protein
MEVSAPVHEFSPIIPASVLPPNGTVNNFERNFPMLRTLLLTAAAVGGLSLAVSATTPAAAGVFTGLQMPTVDSNTVDVQGRCYHRRWSSRWRCRRHRRWNSQWWW